MQTRHLIRVLWILSIAAVVTLFGCSLWFGDLNQDEGWYLYAGRMVAEGNLPFIDFATTQGPIMSLVYAAAWPLVERWGVAGGRLFTAILGMGCIVVASCLARRLAGPRRGAGAALLCLVLLGLNVYQAYFFTVVKTYSLSGLLLALGFLALTYVRGRNGWAASLVCGVFLALAAGVRLSAAVTAPVVFLVLLGGRAVSRTAAWSFLAGVAGTGCAVFLPFAVAAPEAFWFGLVQYHASRDAGGFLTMLAYKAGFVARLLRAYFVPLAALLVTLLWGASRSGSGGGRSTGARVGLAAQAVRFLRTALHDTPVAAALWLSVMAVTLIHVLVAFPYDDYQVMIVPLFAAALGALLAGSDVGAAPEEAASDVRVAGRVPVAVLLIGLQSAAVFASPLVQDWFVGQRDRIWWPLKVQTPLQRLREAAVLVRSLEGGDGLLLTQDTYLAVEAGLRVPAGLELGPFSYFPGWRRARADACHVLNGESMRELLRGTDASVAAFSDYSLAIEAPAVRPLSGTERAALWEVVHERYRPVAEMANFGQAGTVLRILVQKVPDW